MPVTIQFRFRPVPAKLNLSPHHVYLHLRITVNGQRDAGFAARYRHVHPSTHLVEYGEFIVIDKRQWDDKKLQLKGKDIDTLTLNNKLDDLKFAIKDTLLAQQRRYDTAKAPRPTVDSVKFEYLTGKAPSVQGSVFVYPPKFLVRKAAGKRSGKPALTVQVATNTDLGPDIPIVEAVRAYVIELRVGKVASGKMKAQTMARRQCTLDWLTKYPPSTITVQDLSDVWIDRFHEWLLKQASGNPEHKFLNRRMSGGTATTYCSVIIETLDWMRRQRLLDKLPVSPIRDFDLPRFIQKEVIFLNPTQIETLFSVTMKPSRRVSHWWFKLICLTGMDYPDAVRYAQAPAVYETKSPGGNPKIVIRRDKNDKECNIPIANRLVDLWDEVKGEAPHAVSDSTLINHLQDVAEVIGFTHRLTPKVGRKTAGAIFLESYSIKAVSNALGHSSIGITERYYVKVTGHTIDREMDLLSRAGARAA